MKWETLSSEYLFRHEPYIVLRKDVCKQPNGKIVPAYYVAELPMSVIVFPVVDNKVMLIKQYRHPVEEVLWELPGGFSEKNESASVAALRELEEETGYKFSSVKELGKTAANPGILNNYTHIFIANGNYEKTLQQHDEHEDIHLQFFSFEELIEMIRNNEILQSMHLNACLLSLMHLGKLNFC
jgi:ADP-ribose pyrophosphatase YjhB (NUDIX family)